MTQNATTNTNGNGNGNGNTNTNSHGNDHDEIPESPLYTVPPGHLLLHLSANKTAAFSLPSYPAVSFYLYVPSSHPVSRRKRGESYPATSPKQGSVNGKTNGHGHHQGSHGHDEGGGERRYPLVVCMHGSSRDAEGVRNRWADLAEREGLVVLAPLFPVDMNVSSTRLIST